MSDLVNSSWLSAVTVETAGSDCLASVRMSDTCDVGPNPLEHIADDAVRLTGTGVVGRHTVTEDLERRVSAHAVLAAKRLLSSAVDLLSARHLIGEERHAPWQA